MAVLQLTPSTSYEEGTFVCPLVDGEAKWVSRETKISEGATAGARAGTAEAHVLPLGTDVTPAPPSCPVTAFLHTLLSLLWPTEA